ncbi:hypothetical protein JHJ32_16430 [Parapedobacter sp. ISTM3]|nr:MULTISPECIES: hypothetical protein [Parapedobacter]MBK1441587.1 hypothetical protein [Parapedobacter sp. ISTM3]
MKNRKKLWIAFAFIILAGMLGRFAWIYVHETAGVVLIILSTACLAVALTVFARYFSEY